MDRQPVKARTRARRSQYAPQRGVKLRSVFAAGLLVAFIGGLGWAGFRILGPIGGLLSGAGLSNPLAAIQKEVEPPAGSIPYKLRHGQRVNLAVLGYGGAENDAPFLTDSIMVVSLDPASGRVAEVSIPRDLMVPIDAFRSGGPVSQKINVAYSVGMDDADWKGKRPPYLGGGAAGGRLAIDTLQHVTGLDFDGFVAVDFRAFRDLVDAVGGVDVCLDTALDDNQYPDYHDGYIRGGIHFKAGCQHVGGEQALQLARSRHALQPEQASDYGRARRQQQILNAIRRKAFSAGAISRLPQMSSALAADFATSLDAADLKALYDWGGKLPDNAIEHVGITEADLVDRYFMRSGSCGDFYADVLCAQDPSFRFLRTYMAGLFVEPSVLAEKAPVRIDNASATLDEMGDRVTGSLRPLGLHLDDSIRRRTAETTVLYDNSGGRYPNTAKWLAGWFGAQVVQGPAPGATPPGDASAGGLVVVAGRDFALRWIGRA